MSENLHPRADELDDLSALEFVALMHAEDVSAVDAITPTLGEVARAVEAVADRLGSGGRLYYFGAGTSGLIAALDAAECPATFGVAGDRVRAHSVGDAQEDDRDLGFETARRTGLGPSDVAVGISASGKTAFVLGALERAAVDGALSIAITCKPGSPLGRAVDIAIEVDKGPEVIAGSTRLKAGTIQKVTLNMLSTAVFTRLAHTHRGRMVGVVASNEKQRGRAAGVVADLGGASHEEAVSALEAAGGNVKVAIVMLRRGLNADEARTRLEAGGGDLKVVLEEVRRP